MSPKRYHVDWPRTIAGALAAVAAAVVLSKLGAGGTLTGAAVGSLVISIGTNLGAHGISTTRARMLEAQKVAARRVSLAQAEVRRARAAASGASASEESQARLAKAEQELESSQSELAQDVPTTEVPVVAAAGDAPARRGVPWLRMALFAAASFVLALVAITAFELIGGRPLSAYTGGGGHGTTFSDLGGTSSKPKSTPKPAATVSSTPTPPPSPTATVTVTVTPTPTPTVSGSPSATPTVSGTPSTTPSATNTP